jgi:MraZ protein
MLLLTGEYEHTVDEKGRVLVSNKLRNQIDTKEHGSDFYIVVGANGILSLYPEKCFERMMLAVVRKNTAPDEVVAFERMNSALSGKVELDSQGRLLLNEKLRKRAGLKNNVTLVGVRDHIELWNTQDWEQYLLDNMAHYQKQMAQARQDVLLKQSQDLEGWFIRLWRKGVAMLELYPDHCEIVKGTLNGARAIDEQTFASLEVLNDRLERVRKLGGKFTGVEFSPVVENLRKQSSRLAIGQG